MKKFTKTITVIITLTISLSYNTNAQVAITNDGSQPNSNSILHVKGDDTHKNMIIETGTNGGVGIGTINPTHTLHIYNSITDSTLRLEGHEGIYHHGAKVNFGDGDHVYIQEDEDDKLYIKARLRVTLQSQGIAINNDGSEPDLSAILDIKSSNKGFLLPRLSVAEIAAISTPADGLQVYNTTDGELYIYVAILGSWRQLNYGMHSLSSDCGFPITDARDGQTYITVLIGNQCWMAENLNVGIRVNGQYDQLNNGNIEKYCYDDDTLNCDTYGGLYQWAEMVQYLNGATNTNSWSPVPTGNVQGICPTGWHLPTDIEWTTLTDYLGGAYVVAGGKMKEAGYAHWNSPNTGATNFSGFTALPGGRRNISGSSFLFLGYYGELWSSSEDSGTLAWLRDLYYNSDYAHWYSGSKTLGISVRCLKN